MTMQKALSLSINSIGLKNIPLCNTLRGWFASQCRRVHSDPNATKLIQRLYGKKESDQEVVMDESEQLTLTREIIGKVNNQIENASHGRLFAVVYITGRQSVITDEDLLVVKNFFPPNAGDEIRLEKILMVGSRDFSLIGRPLLPKDLVDIRATVVEKTLDATRVMFNYRRKVLNFRKPHVTVLRINSINLLHSVDKLPAVEGVEGRVF